MFIFENKMLRQTKMNLLFVTGVTIVCVFAIVRDCAAKPIDIYDGIVDNDEQQLWMRMVELIDSIGGNSDDSDDDSGRLVTTNSDSNSASTSNELKEMKPGERCIQPVRKGVCRALIPRWSYDPKAKDCREFKFGGCDGNGNNFSTRKQCMETCRGI